MPRRTLLGDRSARDTHLETACAWRIAFEVAGVHLDALNATLYRKPDDDPVVTRTTAALRFPPVAHVAGVAGHDQVVPRSKKHVTARDDERAVRGRCEIDFAAGGKPRPVGRDFSIHAQSRDAAIRIDP